MLVIAFDNMESKMKLRKAHGLSKTPIYMVWRGMRRRCYNTKDISYSYYGGRGIKVVERWHDFENFYLDMGDKPTGMQLDRIDNDGDYGPANCRWVTPTENNNNKRNNLIYHEIIPDGTRFGTRRVFPSTFVRKKDSNIKVLFICDCSRNGYIEWWLLTQNKVPRCIKCINVKK